MCGLSAFVGQPLNPKQLGGVFPQDGALIGFAEAGDAEDRVDFAGVAHEGIGYVEWEIGAEEDMIESQ
jgi:hypothetical protein